MSFASRYNKRKFDVDTTNFDYYTLKALYQENGGDTIYTIMGIYINTKSQYGNAPVIATDYCYVNLPQHLLDDVIDMLSDNEVVNDIKSGKCGFQIYTYQSEKTKGDFYSVKWVDL